MSELINYFDVSDPLSAGDASKRGRKKRATAQRIFISALELMRTAGYEGVSIEDICERAGIARATFFQHFSNKSELMGVASEIVRQRVEMDLETAKASPVDRLFQITDHLKQLSDEIGEVAPEMFSAFAAAPGGGFKIDEPHSGLASMIVDIVAQGQKDGDFSTDTPPEVVAMSLVSAWVGIIRYHISANRTSEDDVLSNVLRLFLKGLQIQRPPV